MCNWRKKNCSCIKEPGSVCKLACEHALSRRGARGGRGDLKKHSFISLPKPPPRVPLCTREPVHRLSVNVLFSRERGLLLLPLTMWATWGVAFCNDFVGDYFCCCEKEISHKCITEISYKKKKRITFSNTDLGSFPPETLETLEFMNSMISVWKLSIKCLFFVEFTAFTCTSCQSVLQLGLCSSSLLAFRLFIVVCIPSSNFDAGESPRRQCQGTLIYNSATRFLGDVGLDGMH